jgi:hypothetical protein
LHRTAQYPPKHDDTACERSAFERGADKISNGSDAIVAMLGEMSKNVRILCNFDPSVCESSLRDSRRCRGRRAAAGGTGSLRVDQRESPERRPVQPDLAAQARRESG